MIYQIKGGFYEEIQKSKMFSKQEQTAKLQKKGQHGKQLLREKVKKE